MTKTAVKEYLYNALPLFFQDTEKDPEKKAPAARRSKKEENKEITEGAQTIRLFTRNTSVKEVVNDPAFQNYGRLLFPLRSGYWSGSTLNDLDFIWYSCIDPDKTVEILNTLKERAEQDGQIFYELYSEEEKAQDPSKRDTGLFFFKGKPNEKFAIVNAGGGHA